MIFCRMDILHTLKGRCAYDISFTVQNGSLESIFLGGVQKNWGSNLFLFWGVHKMRSNFIFVAKKIRCKFLGAVNYFYNGVQYFWDGPIFFILGSNFLGPKK